MKKLLLWLEKKAEDQMSLIVFYLCLAFLATLVVGGILYFIFGQIVLAISENEEMNYTILNIGWWAIIALCLIFFIRHSWKTFYRARVIVPEENVLLLECFNKFVGDNKDEFRDTQGEVRKDLKGVIREGLHFVFPYFNIFKFHNNKTEYFLGNISIDLFKDVNKEKDFPIEVKDTAVNLTATVTIRVHNLIFAVYGVDDYLSLIIKYCEEALRNKCSEYGLKDLLRNKKDFNLGSIFSGDKVKEIKKFTGVEILDFIVTDIGTKKSDMEAMEKVFQAEKELEEAEVKKGTKIKNAEADKAESDIKAEAGKNRRIAEADAEAYALKKQGEAFEDYQVRTKLTSEQIIRLRTVETYGSNSKITFIVDEQGGIPGLGTKLATGLNSQKEN